MPRGPRLDAPGGLHHVRARGLDRQSNFREDPGGDDFVRRLARLAEAGALVVSAWALPPNHCHLLVRTTRKPLPRARRSLLPGYAGAVNRRQQRRGHLLQNRCKALVVAEEPSCLERVRDLQLTPIRAGVGANLRGLDRYPYSGHATVMGAVCYPWQETDTVLRQFASPPSRARARYQGFVADGIGMGRRPELMGGGLLPSAGG
jgi:putative transposase